MTDTLGYRCPVCGGELKFDSETQKMLCIYCDNTFEVSELSKKDSELETQPEKVMKEWEATEQEGMFVYHCSHCGGEIVGDDTLASTNCPFCDMPVVLKSQFRGDLRPEYIIPFKLKKEEAVKKLAEFCKGKKLLPDAFTKNNRIETIRGMYVPFWLFDCRTSSQNVYTGVKTKRWSDSSYNYVKTDYYELRRSGTIDFSKVPVDGSEKMKNDYTESIEPFNYNEMVDFQTAYMAGYIADRYDVSEEAAKEVATVRINNTTKDMMKRTAQPGYELVTETAVNMDCKYTNCSYVLLPVWMLSTQYNGEIFTFAMNGQTGKFIGKLPIDKGKYWGNFFKVTSFVTALMTAVMLLIFM